MRPGKNAGAPGRNSRSRLRSRGRFLHQQIINEIARTALGIEGHQPPIRDRAKNVAGPKKHPGLTSGKRPPLGSNRSTNDRRRRIRPNPNSISKRNNARNASNNKKIARDRDS